MTLTEVDFFTEHGPRIYLPDERARQQKQIDREMAALGIKIEEGKGGRRTIKWMVHSDTRTEIKIKEIPALELTPDEWSQIELCRESYETWGVKHAQDDEGEYGAYTVKRDIFDGRATDSPFNTYHYIAKVTASEEPDKLLTFRKVGRKPELRQEEPFPSGGEIYDDSDFFGVYKPGPIRREYPLQQVLDQYVRKTKNHNWSATYDMASISRVGTYPFQVVYDEHLPKDVRERRKEKTALAFALIVVLKADKDPHDLDICTLQKAYRDDIMAINDIDGQRVTLDFRPTPETTDLDSGWVIDLYNSSFRTQEVRRKYPGYFNDPDEVNRVLRSFAAEARFRAEDLHEVYQELLVEAKKPAGIKIRRDLEKLRLDIDADHLPADVYQLINLFTIPRNVKYLSPLLMEERRMINKRLTAEELVWAIFKTKGAPISALLPREEWVLSNLNLLRLAREKYDQMPSVLGYR